MASTSLNTAKTKRSTILFAKFAKFTLGELILRLQQNNVAQKKKIKQNAHSLLRQQQQDNSNFQMRECARVRV